MKVTNHRLDVVDFRKSPNTSGLIKEHLFVVLHDDVGTWEGTTSWILSPKSKVSYHIYISKSGEVRQFVEMNKRAWHCGVSEWKGYKNLNDYSIGVCFQNKGNEDYADAQIRAGLEVCKNIMEHYDIAEVVRHRDIAPNRKVDPNNKFPWELFKKELNVDANFRTVTTPLNLRSGIGTTNPVMKVLDQNTKVRVLEEKDGWSRVEVVTDTGWVSSKYLK